MITFLACVVLGAYLFSKILPKKDDLWGKIVAGAVVGAIIGCGIAGLIGYQINTEKRITPIVLESSGSHPTHKYAIREGDVDRPTIITSQKVCKNDNNFTLFWICLDLGEESSVVFPRGYLEPSS